MQPNILYLHSHDTGRYISPYGHKIRTPHLQRFAEQGVLFRRAFCANPTCSPSRASLLTGQYAHNNGMLGLAHRGFTLLNYRQHLIHTLREVGYQSALCGVQHIAPPGQTNRIGYDHILPVASNAAADVAPQAAAFLRSRPREPFFLSVGLYETHREFPEHAPEDDPRYIAPPAPLPDTLEVRQDMANFHTCAHRMDEGMGQVLRTLDETGLAANTLVIITTDHGIAFPAMKCSLTDHGIGVMLMMRGPGGFEGGRVIDPMVSHLDLFPTLCDLLEIDPPDWLQGKSMMPLIRRETDALHEAIFAEVNHHAAYEPQRCVRTDRWKYIRRYDARGRVNLPNCDDSPSKTCWYRGGWQDQSLASEYLYDLTFDPNEVRNLADDPAHASTLEAMRNRLNQWMVQTEDPILRGDIPLPAGGGTTSPDDYSPTGGWPSGLTPSSSRH